MSEEVVLPTIVLERIVASAPATVADLAAIVGLGTIKAHSYGPEILAAIARADTARHTEVAR